MSNPRSVPKKHHKLLPLGASVAGGGDDPPPGVFNIQIRHEVLAQLSRRVGLYIVKLPM